MAASARSLEEVLSSTQDRSSKLERQNNKLRRGREDQGEEEKTEMPSLGGKLLQFAGDMRVNNLGGNKLQC